MKKEKKKKIIKLILIVLLIFMIIALIEINKSTNNSDESEPIKIEVPGSENVYPSGTVYLSKEYTGNLEMNQISTKVSDFMLYGIPTLKKIDATIKNVSDYYDNNFKSIKSVCGNISKNEFLDLITLVKKLNSDELKYKTSKYLSDGINKTSNSFEIPLLIMYENENEIQVMVQIISNDVKCIVKK